MILLTAIPIWLHRTREVDSEMANSGHVANGRPVRMRARRSDQPFRRAMSQPLLNSPAPNSSKNAPSPDGKGLAQIENALDVLLTKLLAERKRQREAPGPKPPLRAFSAAELAEMPVLSDREIRRKRMIE